MRDGIYVSPQRIRLLVDDAVKDLTREDLQKSIRSYEAWLKSGEFDLLLSPVGWIWTRYLDLEFPDRIDGVLMVYDAACRELARRWNAKELEEDETRSNRK